MLDTKRVKLGICPIAWTNDDMPDLGSENSFEQCISEMALAGFTGCEIGCKYPPDAKILKPYLDIRGLSVCNCWTSTFFTSKPYIETIQLFKEQLAKLHYLGAKVIGISEQGDSIQGNQNVSIFGKDKPEYSKEEWNTVCKGFNELGSIANDYNMKMVVHHHMGTGIQTLKEIDYLMDNTDEDKVYLLFDSGHAYFAGEDPITVLKKYINRTKHIHLKDVRKNQYEKAKSEEWSFLKSIREGVFTVPGDGCIDFKAIFDILGKNNYEGWVVTEAEQDPNKANPFEYALMARKYIKEKAGL